MGIYIKDMPLPTHAMMLNIYIKNGKPCVTSITDSKIGHIPTNYDIIEIPQPNQKNKPKEI